VRLGWLGGVVAGGSGRGCRCADGARVRAVHPGFVRHLGRTPGRAPFALGLVVAVMPATAVTATYVVHRPSRWTADFMLWPYQTYEPHDPYTPSRVAAPAPPAMAEVRVAGPAGVMLLRNGPAGANAVRRVPLRVGDRVVVSVRLLAPDGTVLAASRDYPLTVAPRFGYGASVEVGPARRRGDRDALCPVPWDAYPIRPTASAAADATYLYVHVAGAPHDAVIC
jgi:hypothetical protein